MTRTSLPVPLTDGRYWRRLLATCHADKPDGDHELFVFLQGLREHVEECLSQTDRGRYTPEDRGGSAPAPDRVPFYGDLPFDKHTRAILAYGRQAAAPHGHVLSLLIDCADARHGRTYEQQYRGATYKQLAAIAHAACMDRQQHQEWYRVCESLRLSQRHAGYILGRLKKEAA
jgi:hypothetical protein